MRGSHRIFAHPTKRGRFVIAGHPSKDLPRGTWAGIMGDAGLGKRETLMQYTIVIEKEENTCYGAYVPDFPGAIGVGDSKQEAIESVRESIRLLLEFDQERNEPHADPWMQTETFMGYLVVVADSWEDEDAEEADGAYRAYVPDLPDCIGVGVTREEAVERVRESMRLYVVEAHRKGLPVPPPGGWTETIEVAAPNASAASAESFSTKGKRGARKRWADRPQLWGAVLADLERGLNKPEVAVARGVSLRSVQEIARRAGVSRPPGRPRKARSTGDAVGLDLRA